MHQVVNSVDYHVRSTPRRCWGCADASTQQQRFVRATANTHFLPHLFYLSNCLVEMSINLKAYIAQSRHTIEMKWKRQIDNRETYSNARAMEESYNTHSPCFNSHPFCASAVCASLAFRLIKKKQKTRKNRRNNVFRHRRIVTLHNCSARNECLSGIVASNAPPSYAKGFTPLHASLNSAMFLWQNWWWQCICLVWFIRQL